MTEEVDHPIVETDSGGDKHWWVLRCRFCSHVFEAPTTNRICPKCKNKGLAGRREND